MSKKLLDQAPRVIYSLLLIVLLGAGASFACGDDALPIRRDTGPTPDQIVFKDTAQPRDGQADGPTVQEDGSPIDAARDGQPADQFVDTLTSGGDLFVDTLTSGP